MTARHAASAVLAVCLLAVTAACTAVPAPEEIVPVTPGAPGGGAATASPAAPAETAADERFMARMLRHHEQGVELAALAAERSGDPRVARVAARIAAAQAAEIDHLSGWLARRGLDAGAHDHEGMPGELSRSTLDRAALLSGTAFDLLFLDAMIRHHAGAITMAEERLGERGDGAVTRLARAIVETQSADVERMRELLPASG